MKPTLFLAVLLGAGLPVRAQETPASAVQTPAPALGDVGMNFTGGGMIFGFGIPTFVEADPESLKIMRDWANDPSNPYWKSSVETLATNPQTGTYGVYVITYLEDGKVSLSDPYQGVSTIPMDCALVFGCEEGRAKLAKPETMKEKTEKAVEIGAERAAREQIEAQSPNLPQAEKDRIVAEAVKAAKELAAKGGDPEKVLAEAMALAKNTTRDLAAVASDPGKKSDKEEDGKKVAKSDSGGGGFTPASFGDGPDSTSDAGRRAGGGPGPQSASGGENPQDDDGSPFDDKGDVKGSPVKPDPARDVGKSQGDYLAMVLKDDSRSRGSRYKDAATRGKIEELGGGAAGTGAVGAAQDAAAGGGNCTFDGDCRSNLQVEPGQSDDTRLFNQPAGGSH